jgi:hypothetical protein
MGKAENGKWRIVQEKQIIISGKDMNRRKLKEVKGYETTDMKWEKIQYIKAGRGVSTLRAGVKSTLRTGTRGDNTRKGRRIFP